MQKITRTNGTKMFRISSISRIRGDRITRALTVQCYLEIPCASSLLMDGFVCLYTLYKAQLSIMAFFHQGFTALLYLKNDVELWCIKFRFALIKSLHIYSLYILRNIVIIID